MHRRVLLIVGSLTAIALVLSAKSQMYDSNFYLLWEAAALIAGDHPYRDFFEWGAPLGAYVSAAMQLLVGYRLIGEFGSQWAFITAGVVISFHLGLQLSRSVGASLVMFAVALPIVAYAPTYHYSKLFFFPATVWLAWRYMDRPVASRAALFGATTAAAFLFRHDYGVYIGFASVVAFVLARFSVPASRQLGSMMTDAAAYAAAAGLVLLPWAVVVQMHEGLLEYVRARTMLYERPSTMFVYPTVLTWNPVEVVASWFQEPTSRRAAENGVLWLKQVGLLMPLLLLGAAASTWWHSHRRGEAVPRDVWRMALAGAFLGAVAAALFREPPYVVVTVPLTAALGARFLVARGRLQRALAIGVVSLTAVAGLVWTKDSPLFSPSELREDVSDAFVRLMASPPIPAGSTGAPAPHIQYLRDCSVPGDRIFVTGSTPFQVGYYTRRPPAGGHIFWRQRFLRDPAREQQSLEMLQRQSVPFAISTNDPVLKDLEVYPRIHEYMAKHYVEVEGFNGNLLVDSRRQPTGTFGPEGLPCFR